ncbi:MAG: 50S ribosomal protein L3 [Candidatus Parcubacteria bacterium]|nr:50S ribosomal protein L3 [Candidatus Parcubacteria bacterium]
MKFILGKKIGMSQIFDTEGRVKPVSILEAKPNTVVQIKNQEKDGYTAVQIGTGEIKKLKKPQKGHLKKALPESDILIRHLKEFVVSENDLEKFKAGDKIDVSVFTEGEKVNVTGISKGKGFQGGVKRYGFHGHNKTHGTKHSERAPGSIGGTHPQHVIKGRRMAGRMGGDQITVKNLKILQIDLAENLILVSGALPGKKGDLLKIVGK